MTPTPRIVKADGKGSTSLAVDRSGGHVIKFEDAGGGLFLTPQGVTHRGLPTFGSYENAMSVSVYFANSAPFWKADLLAYARTREDWEGFIDNVIDAGTFTKKTVDQYVYVSKAVAPDRRVEGLSMGHHEKVAALEPDDQSRYLKRAKAEHLSVSELQQVIRKERKVKRVVSGQAGELKKAHHAVAEHAYEASALCRQIPAQDGAQAEKALEKVRRELDRCEAAIVRYRKAQGKS